MSAGVSTAPLLSTSPTMAARASGQPFSKPLSLGLQAGVTPAISQRVSDSIKRRRPPHCCLPLPLQPRRHQAFPGAKRLPQYSPPCDRLLSCSVRSALGSAPLLSEGPQHFNSAVPARSPCRHRHIAGSTDAILALLGQGSTIRSVPSPRRPRLFDIQLSMLPMQTFLTSHS